MGLLSHCLLTWWMEGFKLIDRSRLMIKQKINQMRCFASSEEGFFGDVAWWEGRKHCIRMRGNAAKLLQKKNIEILVGKGGSNGE